MIFLIYVRKCDQGGQTTEGRGNGMTVALGSTNPAKRAATERVVDDQVAAVAVDSGVPDQPRTEEATVRGAEQRADRAMGAVPDATLGVGLEGGFSSDCVRPGVWLCMWAVVTDGDSIGRGRGPSLALPPTVVEALEGGETLGTAIDRMTGTPGTASTEGAIGVLTGGRLDRALALETALSCAYAPFHTG